MRTLQVISPRMTGSRRRLVNIIEEMPRLVRQAKAGTPVFRRQYS
jgi:hypothetical protein